MSTRANDLALENALKSIPKNFRTRIIKHYIDLKSAFAEGQYDACGVRAGKFCETMIRFLQEHLTGKSTPFGQKISNLGDECAKFERIPAASFPESLRVMIPRALAFLYTLRNKRGIAHVGGEVDANEIDAVACLRIADWCLCELIRIFHALSLEEAQALLDAIAARQIPQIWTVVGKKRVLDNTLGYKDQTLLLLYSEQESGIPTSGIPVEDLFDWVEHPRQSDYRKDILRPLHSQRLIEYDQDTEVAIISPRGIKEVETRLLSTL
ncbi:MAG TPA: hypothetical protein VF644_06820 [Pyrinomonadaceae bacterium]|jgi:hypothetical protein